MLHGSYEQSRKVILAHHIVPSTHTLVGLELWQLLENSNKALLLLIVDTKTLIDRVELVTKLWSLGRRRDRGVDI